MTDNTKWRVCPLKPFPASLAEAPAQRNKSDAWAKAASKLTLLGAAYCSGQLIPDTTLSFFSA
jgi:hypothetical protein